MGLKDVPEETVSLSILPMKERPLLRTCTEIDTLCVTADVGASLLVSTVRVKE